MGNENVDQFLQSLLNVFLEDKKPNESDKQKIKDLVKEKKNDELLYKLFCFSILIKDPMLKIEKPKEKEVYKNKCDFFYLSEKNKTKKIVQFIKEMEDMNFAIDFSYLSLLQSIILYSNYNFNNELMHIIVRRLIEIWPSQKFISRGEKLWLDFSMYFSSSSIETINKIDKWKPVIILEDIIKENEKILDLFLEAKKSKDYTKIEKEIDRISHWNSYLNNKYFLDFLVNKKFLFPNIKLNINESIWRYCYVISEYYGRMCIKDRYIDYLKQIIKNCFNDNTVKNRCEKLIEIARAN